MARIKTLQYLLGKYRNPDATMDAVKELNAEGFTVYDVYTPFPVHGMDKLLGIKRSRLSIAAFCFGCLGLVTAIFMQSYMLGFDWPQDIGGKPFIGASFVPVSFELTVLFTAFGMVISFFVVSKLFPGKAPVLMDERVTDDVFVVAIDRSRLSDEQKARITEIFNSKGAFEVADKDVIDEFFKP